MSYEKIRAVLNHSKEADSLADLVKRLGTDPAFFYGKRKKPLIRRQRKQYIDTCIRFGLLDEDYHLTDLGRAALTNFNEVISSLIFELDFNGRNFKDLLFTTLGNVDIPTTERIHEKVQELGGEIPIQQLRTYLNILAKCGALQKNRKYTYTLPPLTANDFESLLRQEYLNAEKDPSGLIWFEQFRETMQKKYNLSQDQFENSFSELKKKKPRLISLQRSRSKTWFLLREV